MELSRVIAVTTSLSGTHPFPEWSALAWGTTDDTLWRANPYDAAEWVWLTVIAAFFMGTTGVIVAGISAGAQGPGTLLSSVFGALLAGWITWAFLEPLRVRIAAALRGWRLDLPATTGQRLVALGDFVLFESGGHCWKVQPDVTVVVRSRATKSGLWRFYLQEGGKVFSRLESDDADALEALLRALGFKVEA